MEGTVMVSKNEQFEFRILEDFREGKISRQEAATILGVAPRTIQRRAKKVRLLGIKGVKHGNYQKPPHNLIDQDLKSQMLSLASERYYDFNMVHCLEMLEQHHGLKVSYSTFHAWCRAAGIGKRKKRRTSKQRVYRERMSNEGLLLQMDGSHHRWNGKDEWALIAMIDDATSDIPYAEFFLSEDTRNCLKVLRRVIEVRGIPEAIYVDRAGWFGGIKRQYFSQFVRACEELGIRVIYANSPEAKGRIERAWRTFQDRLIPELRIQEITSMASANNYMLKTFIPQYWQQRNTVCPRSAESRYQALEEWQNLDEILCLKFERKVRHNRTIYYNNTLYSLGGSFIGSLKGKTVVLHERENGDLKAYYGHLQLELTEVRQPQRRGGFDPLRRPA